MVKTNGVSVRKFDGKGYVKTTTHQTKKRARESVKRNIREGVSYRIIKDGKNYVVYIRLTKKTKPKY